MIRQSSTHDCTARVILDRCVFSALVLALIVFGMNPCVSFANTDRYTIWDETDGTLAELFNDQKIDEYEYQSMEDVLGLGRSGEIEEAIKSLNAFLRGCRNTALREIARNVFALLIKQQKENEDYWRKHSKDKPTCPLDMKLCPNGEIVERDGPKCTFNQCQQM